MVGDRDVTDSCDTDNDFENEGVSAWVIPFATKSYSLVNMFKNALDNIYLGLL